MAFEYGQQLDSSGNIVHEGSWGVQSSPKLSIPIIIEDLRYLKDEAPKLSLADAKIYTDTKVASLVSSAPATLDTLNELATALGNDPNFATTVTSLIGTKASTVDVYSKTVGDAKYTPKGFGLGEFCTQKTAINLDALILVGFYYAINCTNTPGADGYLIVSSLDANTISHDFTIYNGNKYNRVRNAGIWSAWKQLATLDQVAPKGFGLGELVSSVASGNITSMASCGFFGGWNVANAPASDNFNYISTKDVSGTLSALLAFQLDGTNANRALFKIGNNAWKQLATTDNPTFIGSLGLNANAIGGVKLLGNDGTTGSIFLTGDAGATKVATKISMPYVSGNSGSNALIISTSNTALVYGDDPSSVAYTPRLAITRFGNVGIGILDPTCALDVNGAIKASGSMLLADATAKTKIVLNGIGSNYGTVQSDLANTWSLGYKGTNTDTLGTPVLSWNTNGRVGIGGVLDPQATLHSSYSTNYLASNSYSGAFGNGSKALLLGYDTTINAGVIQASNINTSWSSVVINPSGQNLGIGGVLDPQATLHSTGSTILGCAQAVVWSQIGNLQLNPMINGNALSLQWKDASGSTHSVVLTAPS